MAHAITVMEECTSYSWVFACFFIVQSDSRMCLQYTNVLLLFTNPLCSIVFPNKTDHKETFLCQSCLSVSVSHAQNLFLSLTATQDSWEQNPIQYIH